MSDGGIVRLVFNSIAQGGGFADLVRGAGEARATVGALARAARSLGSEFGAAGGAAGRFIGAMAQGGLMGAAAGAAVEGVRALASAWREHNALMADAALAAKGLSREYMTLEAAARGYQKRVESWRKAKAAADKAEADAAKAKARAAEEEKRRDAAHLDYTNRYLSLEQQVADEARRRESLGADELRQLELKVEAMREAAKLAVSAAERNLGAARKGGDGYAIDVAAKELELAKERQKTVEVMAKKEFDDREKRIRKETEARLAAVRREAAARKAAFEADQRDKARARIAELKESAQERLAALDREIAKERGRAEGLEANAARARGGKTFGEWQRGERDIERQKRREESRQARVTESAAKRAAALEDEARRFGKGFSPQRARELARLREFVVDQDPKNNPALRNVAELEEKRTKVVAQMQKDIADIAKALKDGGVAI